MTEGPAQPARIRDALLAAAEVGPFFRLEVLQPTAPGWQASAELYRGGVPGLVSETARQLGTDETRVAASILYQGIAARLWAPVLGCAILREVVPDLDVLAVRTALPVELGLTGLSGWAVPSAADAARVSARVVSQELGALAAALPVPLADGLLRGNSASAMAGALSVLVRARPDLAGPAAALARELLQAPGLRGAGVLSGPAPFAFRRNSCCLYYRVPAGGLCGDCGLDHKPEM